MFGFVKTGPFAAENRKSEYSADIEEGTHDLYVYCNLMKPVAVGNAWVPLLRMFCIQKGLIVITFYIKVFYYPVMRKIFGALEITIKGTKGEIIPHYFLFIHNTLLSSRVKYPDNCCDDSIRQAYE